MKQKAGEKLKSKSGVSILILVLLAATLVMVLVILFPVLQGYGWDAGEIGCALGINSAQRKVDNTTILAMHELTQEEVMKAATQSVADFSELCPAGGEIYLDPRSEGGYEVVCGLHDSDALRKTRLNSARTLERLQALLDVAKRREEDFPQRVSVTLNGKELLVERTETDTGLNRGTYSIGDYSGTVAFYKLEDMEITYFSFADENHAATWRKGAGWVYDAP